MPNPAPATSIQDLDLVNGVLYAMTGYILGPAGLQVFGLDPVTGTVVRGPVSIGPPAGTTSDGFTVLPNGNFLINKRRRRRVLRL